MLIYLHAISISYLGTQTVIISLNVLAINKFSIKLYKYTYMYAYKCL